MFQNIPESNQTFKILNQDLELALTQVSLGFWEVSLKDTKFMTCTDQCKRNFGWSLSNPFSYEDMVNCILPEDQPAMKEQVHRAVWEKLPYFAQYRIKHPDGSIHWIEAQGNVIYESGVPQKITGTTLDITKTKDLETLRDELLSITLHELKTPLSTVKSSLQILERHLKKQSDEKMYNLTSRALGSTDRINRLLEDMVSPIIAQSTEIILNKVDFDLITLAEEIAQNTMLLHPRYKIDIQVPERTVMVYADRHRIAQVITNLVNNSIKYSPHHTDIVIDITANSDAAFIRIVDNGMGIAKSDRHNVFKKFFRTESGKSMDGLGIGLYLCSEIILRHGGRISVEDTKHEGTTILLSIPFMKH